MTSTTASRSTRALITFYGDDFTGSTDVMEALTTSGIDTVLFLDPPSAEDLARFPDARGIGVAGIARTMTPRQMEAQLPPILRSLRAVGAPLFHYKICSTFDSSPEVGSIGRGLEIARREFGSGIVPMVVGAPMLRRYQIFGTLFATADGLTHRLDRHPTMMRHPITPMDEADVTRHLRRQTGATVALVDRLTLAAGAVAVDDRIDDAAREGAEVLLFDVLDDADLAEIGRVIDGMIRRADETVVAVGSSGVEYALAAHHGLMSAAAAPFTPRYGPRVQTLAVSGSRAPASDAQVAHALAHGFRGVAVDPHALTTTAIGIDELVSDALTALGAGDDVLLHTPPRGGDSRVDSGALGRALGTATRRIVREAGIRRLVVAGGDTSGLVARSLGVLALRMIAPLAPGAPLCRATSDDPAVDGLELALKGGQVGAPDYFTGVAALDDTPNDQRHLDQ